MKSKQTVSSNKQTIIVKDLKTRKNPKGGAAYDPYLKFGSIKANPTGGSQGFTVKLK